VTSTPLDMTLTSKGRPVMRAARSMGAPWAVAEALTATSSAVMVEIERYRMTRWFELFPLDTTHHGRVTAFGAIHNAATVLPANRHSAPIAP
jgi:hypothetical protein